MRGLEFAMYDIGLAAFTTLAPAAAFAYVALALLVLFGRLEEQARARLEGWLILPLAIATVGLIASATHLGDPGNALYVFVKTGTSSLSNEVLATVVFLGTTCSQWLAGVYTKRLRAFRSAWLFAGVLTALVFVAGTTSAYAFSTVVTWNTPYALAALPLAGLAGSAPLIVLVLLCARVDGRRGFAVCAWAVSLLATAVGCVVMAMQYVDLGTIQNAYGTAAELAPFYPAAIAAFGACVFLAALLAVPVFPVLDAPLPQETAGACLFGVARGALVRCVASVLLAYAGIFAVRFCFYCFHMTAGVI